MDRNEEAAAAENNVPFWISSILSICDSIGSSSDVSSLTSRSDCDSYNSTISPLLVEPLLTPCPPQQRDGQECVATPIVRDVQLVIENDDRNQYTGERRRFHVRKIKCCTTVIALVLVSFLVLCWGLVSGIVWPYRDPVVPDNEAWDGGDEAVRMQKLITFLLLITLDDDPPHMDASSAMIQELVHNTTLALPEDASAIVQWYALATLRYTPGSVVVTEEHEGDVVLLSAQASNEPSSQLPADIGLLTSVRDLQLSGWNGPIPSVLGRLTNLQQVDLSSNDWYGTIPAPWSRWSTVESISLAHMPQMTGPIPDAWCDVETLLVIDARGTGLEAPACRGWWDSILWIDDDDSGILDKNNATKIQLRGQ